ncbi:metal ABC transporter substrate-binding protein [Glutamicibacter creatinolyticus]|uniref:metal ABC transporter substrate-binding protein n=1 Tax=Glutamicibacter creatinolyticus TaxID=162496 RepID=UPI0037BFEF77
MGTLSTATAHGQARRVHWLLVPLMLLLVACTPAQQTGTGAVVQDDRPVVLTTFTVLADIARNVGGEHLRVESITKFGAEIHGYEPTPEDLRRAADADLILDNGLNLEAWFEQFVADVPAPHVQVSAGVEPIAIADGDASGHPNPHAWMSPVNVKIYVQNMARAFAELDPEHAADYQANAAAYQQELQGVQDELLSSLAQVPTEQRVLVTCEGAFSYLARDAGLREEYLWAVNSETQATPRKVAAAIDYVREHQVPAVFCESTVSDAAMQRVVESTEAQYGGQLYVDSLSAAGGPVPTYLELITHDTRTIAKALNGAAQ